MVDLAIAGLEIEPIPAWLGEPHRVILVSNYPSVSQSLRALTKLLCRLRGKKARLKGIGRPEVVARANWLLKALGISNLVFPVRKDEAGTYRLDKKVVKEVLAYLDGYGSVLWLSTTGRTRGNGLLEEDLRTGAALFCATKRVPIVPIGLVTGEKKGKLRVSQIRFGEPLDPPAVEEMDDFEKSDFLMDFTRLAMCQVAKLLPRGQRGDFEDADDKLVEVEARLRMSQL